MAYKYMLYELLWEECIEDLQELILVEQLFPSHIDYLIALIMDDCQEALND